MHQLLSLLVALAIFTTLHANPTPSKTYQNHAILDKDGEYQLFWEPDYYKIKITFEVHAKTTGYVGLGFSPKGSMAHADIVIGWIDGSTKVLKDCHGQDQNGPPDCNENQNVTLLSISVNDSWTMLKFERKIELCEKTDLPITEGTMRVIWAMGTSNDLIWHGNRRGTQYMYLLGVKPLDAPMPKDVKKVDLTMKNFRLPMRSTHYECGILQISASKLKDKLHVIRYDPVITKGNELYVHHMVMFLCPAELNDNVGMLAQVNRHGDCNGQQSWGFGKCLDPVFSWAVGAKNFTFPIQTGVPVGSDQEAHYLRLEMHYDNPQLKPNIVDSSGFRLYLTPTLRKHDLGVINIGKRVDFTHMIPPKTTFTSIAYSPPICTGKAAFGGFQEVKAIGIGPHTHLIGTGVKHRHFRNGVELPPLIDDQTYDFNWQIGKMFAKEITIRQGDDFMVECRYNSSSRTETTLGGLGTRDEMCMTFLWVYPRIPLNLIRTGTNYDTHRRMVNQHKLPGAVLQYKNITELRNMLKKEINWSKRAIAEWQYIEKESKNYRAICGFTYVNTSTVKSYEKLQPFEIKQPYPSIPACFSAAGATVAISHVAMMSSVIVAIYFVASAH